MILELGGEHVLGNSLPGNHTSGGHPHDPRMCLARDIARKLHQSQLICRFNEAEPFHFWRQRFCRFRIEKLMQGKVWWNSRGGEGVCSRQEFAERRNFAFGCPVLCGWIWRRADRGGSGGRQLHEKIICRQAAHKRWEVG